MQIIDIWNKFDLYWPKVILVVIFGFSGITSDAQSRYEQKPFVRKNNPNYDDRKISYGFLIGLHTAALQIRYSDQFVTPAFDTVYAVHPTRTAGFKLGFIVNFRAEEFLDFRLTPNVSFYEHQVDYIYTNQQKNTQLVETTMVEFPFLAKYKSARRGNIRMYMIGGISPGIEASGKKDLESSVSSLELDRFNLSLEAGFGFDLYYPLFKFSPELRFSRGIRDMLGNRSNIYGQPLKSVTMNTVTIYLLFQ